MENASAHLSVGTAKENAADKIRDGTILRGSKVKRAKITEEIAKQIKVSEGHGTNKQRSRQFNVSFAMVKDID